MEKVIAERNTCGYIGNRAVPSFPSRQIDNIFQKNRNFLDWKPKQRCRAVRVCNYCTKTFQTISELNIHVRIHTGEKPYECIVCKMKFSQNVNLVRHQRKLHAVLYSKEPKPVKAFVCIDYPDCDKSFDCKPNLIEHLRVHTGERPFICPECKKCFTQKTNMFRHLSNIHRKESNTEQSILKIEIKSPIQSVFPKKTVYQSNSYSQQDNGNNQVLPFVNYYNLHYKNYNSINLAPFQGLSNDSSSKATQREKLTFKPSSTPSKGSSDSTMFLPREKEEIIEIIQETKCESPSTTQTRYASFISKDDMYLRKSVSLQRVLERVIKKKGILNQYQ